MNHTNAKCDELLDEQTIAKWLSIQIEDGHILLEDIPKLMARYALADPGDMRDELSERMGLTQGANPGEQPHALNKIFRVLGAHASREFFDIEVHAVDGLAAFGAAARVLEEAGEESDAELFAVVPAGSTYFMPGDGVVMLETILDPENAHIYGL